MKTECSLTVRTYECDSNGHVNNAVYLNYLEHARYEYLRDIGFDYNAAVAAGYGIYIARLEIEYKKPAFTDDRLTVISWPVKKGAVSGTIAQEIYRGDELLTNAKVTWAFVDSRGVPSRIPAEFDREGLYPAKT
jgi:acyl-CoA thioester hydrolase